MKRASANVVTYDDEAALAYGVAERIVELADRTLAERGRFTIALAGGTTPKTTYGLLAMEPFRSAIAWHDVRFFFGDERCVPPDHADSNYRMARETLLGPLAVSEDAVARMAGEEDPDGAASAYARILRERLGPSVALDLIMLGMGPDGHTASLFPGTDPTVDSARLVRAPYVDKFSSYRLTITPTVINAAANVFIVTAGQAKAERLAAVLGDARDPSNMPIQIVAPTDGRLTWLVDRAAAARL